MSHRVLDELRDGVNWLSAWPQEKEILDMYTRRFVNGTGADVAATLNRLHEHTRVDEVMLVTMGPSRDVHARTVELVADHYAMAASTASSSRG